jgi:hypothetical protein
MLLLKKQRQLHQFQKFQVRMLHLLHQLRHHRLKRKEDRMDYLLLHYFLEEVILEVYFHFLQVNFDNYPHHLNHQEKEDLQECLLYHLHQQRK